MILHILQNVFKKEVYAMGRLVINGEEIYELDEQCLKEKYEKQMQEKHLHTVEEKKDTNRYFRKQGRRKP